MNVRSPQPGQPLPGRNDPCWCGSGRKYKQCHLASDEAIGREQKTLTDIARQLQRTATKTGVSAKSPPPSAQAISPSASVQKLLQQAADHHRAGRLHEAELGYRAVLAREANNVDAIHLLGLVALAAGHRQAGEQLIAKAVALHPDFAEARSNLGNYLREEGRAEEALSHLQRAVALKPGLANAHHNLGIVFNELGRTREAIAEHRLALSLQPNYPEALNSLGNELKSIDALDEAEDCYRRALALRPDYPEALNGMGIVQHARLQRKAAEESFRRAIALRPQFAEAHSNLGLLMHAQDRLPEAAALCRAALKMKSNYPDGHNNLGIVLHAMHDYAGAEAEYRAALALKPNGVDAMSNLGGALHAQGRMEEADAWCRKAIALRPEHADGYQKYGIVCIDQGRTDEAIALYRRAIELRPEYPLAHWSLALALLTQGQYEEGWPAYEWRFKCPELMLDPSSATQPTWDGSNFAGRTLLLHGEQGLGDAIQFVRYAPLAAERGGRVVVSCRSALRSLIARMPGVSAVTCEGEEAEPSDLQASLLSLPAIFRTTRATIPANVPYLSVDPAKQQRWAERVARFSGGKRKVGLVWAGNPAHKNDRQRSCGLAALEPLGALNNVTFFSVQKGSGAAELQKRAAEGSALASQLIDWTDELNDFDDTAALLANLDLLITIDSAVAHLAGAINIPVWNLVTFSADWRWLEHRDDSPWYPSMRLFRQSQRDDWPGVIQRVVDQLR